MLIKIDSSNTAFHLQRFEPGKIWINEKLYTQSLLLHANTLTLWRPQTLTDVILADFDSLMTNLPQVLLVGTGTTLALPPIELAAQLQGLGIGVEFMDTRAACFTYTALCSEERQVSIALLLK